MSTHHVVAPRAFLSRQRKCSWLREGGGAALARQHRGQQRMLPGVRVALGQSTGLCCFLLCLSLKCATACLHAWHGIPAPWRCRQRFCSGAQCVRVEQWPSRWGCWVRCVLSVRCCGGWCRCLPVRQDGGGRRWQSGPCGRGAGGVVAWRSVPSVSFGSRLCCRGMVCTHLEQLQVEQGHDGLVGLGVFVVRVVGIPSWWLHGALERCARRCVDIIHHSVNGSCAPLTALVSNQLSRAPSSSSTRSKSSHLGASNSYPLRICSLLAFNAMVRGRWSLALARC